MSKKRLFVIVGLGGVESQWRFVTLGNSRSGQFEEGVGREEKSSKMN